MVMLNKTEQAIGRGMEREFAKQAKRRNGVSKLG